MYRKERLTNAFPATMKPLEGIKPYNIVQKEDDTAEITMYGEVVEQVPVDWWTGEPVPGLFISLTDFLTDIDALKDKKSITVRLNSVGGELEAGVAIYNRLKEMNDVTMIVDGLAASAASLILQAGSKRKVYSSSQVMAHEASVTLFGSYNSQDLDGVNERLKAANDQVIAIYAEKTGQSTTKLKHMVEKTTWMTGQKIVEEGFADEVIEGKNITMSMNKDMTRFMCNGIPMDIRRLESVPPNVKIVTERPKDSTAKADDDKNKQPEGGKNMTLEELKAQHPELVKQVEDEAKGTVNMEEAEERARSAERARIKDIEAIEKSIGDKELVNEAKYGEKPMDARDLAFIAMQKQSQLGNNFLQNNQKDVDNSGAGDVHAKPNSGAGDDAKDKDAENIMAAVNAVNQTRGGK